MNTTLNNKYDFVYNFKHMYCFYRVMSSVVAFTDIINHLYTEDQLNVVSIMNLITTFVNQIYIKKFIKDYI